MIYIDDDYSIEVVNEKEIQIKDLKREGEILFDLEVARVLTFLLIGILDAKDVHDETKGSFKVRGHINRR